MGLRSRLGPYFRSGAGGEFRWRWLPRGRQCSRGAGKGGTLYVQVRLQLPRSPLGDRGTSPRWQCILRIRIFADCSNQSVVIGIATDPVPDDAISLHDPEGAVAETDASRIDVVLAFHFLELKSGMCGIALENSIGTLGVPLNIE